MFNVVTSFNKKYWNEVAKKNILLLDKYWDKGSTLNLYHELDNEEYISSRVNWYDLYRECPKLPEFVETWKNNPQANGAKNFRTNAVKFVHKTFAIWKQAEIQKSGWLIWLDCDTIVLKPINDKFLRSVCPENYAISYMGRPGKYSECGFIGFNLSYTEARDFLKEWENLYLSGEFINLPETHDSWTFDFLRKQKNENLFFNVNSKAITNKNPFAQSMLGTYIAHAKGEEKNKKQKKILKRTID